MPFQRRIHHHGPTTTGTPVLLADQAITKCWFELHRQGGCGAAELSLSSTFEQRESIEIGDWISFSYDDTEPWYLGRVEERQTESPAILKLRLQGMSIQLNEVFPGGFGTKADGRKPHRYAATDLFTHDPDRSDETFDSIAHAEELVKLLLSQYVSSQTDIICNPDRVEAPAHSAPLTSLKLRGEESVRTILKELAVRAQSASWGVDARGEFFFVQPANQVLATYQEGHSLTKLGEVRDYELLFNRLLLTGDYVYDRREASEYIARRSYRWRGNFMEPNSQAQFGDRRLKIWLPWIRTQADSLSFAKQFFKIYSQPTNRYLIETTAQELLPVPWLGRVTLHNYGNQHLITSRIETVRVLFDHLPQFRMELGPEDPRALWPEPPHDERWELPDQVLSAGGTVSISDSNNDTDPPPPPTSLSSLDFSSSIFPSWTSSGSSGSSESSRSSGSSGSFSSHTSSNSVNDSSSDESLQRSSDSSPFTSEESTDVHSSDSSMPSSETSESQSSVNNSSSDHASSQSSVASSSFNSDSSLNTSGNSSATSSHPSTSHDSSSDNSHNLSSNDPPSSLSSNQDTSNNSSGISEGSTGASSTTSQGNSQAINSSQNTSDQTSIYSSLASSWISNDPSFHTTSVNSWGGTDSGVSVNSNELTSLDSE